MRASVRSRRRWRMISWPAAKLIRWVKPSIATVSPSRTRSRTASCIEVTLLIAVAPTSQLFRRPVVAGPPQHAELVALDVEHDRPERSFDVDPAEHRGAEG